MLKRVQKQVSIRCVFGLFIDKIVRSPLKISFTEWIHCVNITRTAHRGGGKLGHFAPGPSLKGAPGGPMKGPLNTCLKDRYTLIEQSDLNTLIEQSQYSSEEQCSKLIDKEIWLVMGSYCHCQQVVTFFFFFLSSPYSVNTK